MKTSSVNGFVQQVGSLLQNSVPGDKAVRVSGHEENLQSGLPASTIAPPKDAAVLHAGHHHVGEQKVEKA